jgi:hypothetical protein
LNWALAQMGDVPEAATQPSLRLDADPKALLGAAESAYTEVLTQYADQNTAVVAANFGLAAVYESLGNWDNAKQKYQQILDNPGTAEAYRTQAKFRLERVADWSKPVLLAAATQPATEAPFAIPASTTTQSTTAPATLPTTGAVER